MLTVATSKLISGPTRLLYPRFTGSVGEASEFPFSLLGVRLPLWCIPQGLVPEAPYACCTSQSLPSTLSLDVCTWDARVTARPSAHDCRNTRV